MKSVLKPESLYITDNGACYCGDHCGMTAQATGRDISGQEVMEVTPEMVRSDPGFAAVAVCEVPRCERKASLLHRVSS